MNMDRPEAADTAEPGRLAQDPMDYREEAKLWIALEAGLGTLSGMARVMGISHPEAEAKYASWEDGAGLSSVWGPLPELPVS